VLSLSFVGSAVAGVGVALARSSVFIVLFWVLAGLSQAAVYPIMLRCLGPIFDDSIRGRMLGTWLTSMQVGAFSSTFIGAQMAKFLGWRWTFAIPSCGCLVIALLLFFFIPSGATSDDHDSPLERRLARTMSGSTSTTCTPVQSDSESEESPQVVLHTPTIDHEVPVTPLAVLRHVKDIGNIALAYFFVKLVRYCMLNWLPYYFERGLGYEKVVARNTSTFFDMGALLGSLFTGVLSDNILGRRPLFASCLMCPLAAVSIGCFAASASWGFWAVVVSVAFIGFSISGPDSVLGAAASQDLCERSPFGLRAISITAGVVNSTGSAGAMFQGALTTFIAMNFGWEVFFGTLMVGLVGSVFLLLPTLQRERMARLQPRKLSSALLHDKSAKTYSSFASTVLQDDTKS